MVPRTLEACVHVTRRVLSLSRASRSRAVSLGPWSGARVGCHHFTTRPSRSARLTHGATFASSGGMI